MRYRYPLHVHISTLFLLLILFLCIVLGWIGFALSSNLLEASAARLTAGISREALLEMRRVIEPAEVVTRLLSQQRVTTATSLQRRLDSLKFLQQALAGSSALSSLYVGYDNGDFFLFGRVDQGSQSEAAKAPAGATYVVQSIERSGPVARGRFIYLDAALQTLREDDRPDYAAAYDPRNRIWFTEGLASSTQIKTPPYRFFSSGKVGTTLANRSADGRSVVGADILLHTLGEILAREKVTPGSQMVLVNAQGYVLAYADDAQMLRDAAASDGRSALARIDELGVPALVPLLETVRKLRDIARDGTYRDMAALADATPGFRSNNADMTHKDYWYLKMRAGDWPMAQAEKLLTYRHTVAQTRQGKVYVWPWMAVLKPGEITPAAERDINRLLGDGQADALRRGGVWPGYVLGIAEDGAWLYFISGSG